MEFLRVVKRRSLLSEIIYILLNLGLAAATLISVWATGTPWLAFALVVLSKWRVFAVRPRFWYAHLESNLVDIIVSLSVVILIYLAGFKGTDEGTIVQIVLAVLYGVWLLLIKPRSKRSFITTQAAIAIFFGSMAIASVSYEWPSSLVVLLVWVIGYAGARHVLVAYSDEDIRLMSLIWAFVLAEIAWLTYHWTIAYTLPFAAGLKLPQMTLLLLGISFLAERVYASHHKHGFVRFGDISLPLFLVVGVTIVLMVLFNSASIGSV